MAQPAYSYEAQEARLVSGTVLGLAGTTYRVRTGNSVCTATLAVSCLLAPQVHDTVLTAHLEDGASVILSVLYRQEAPAIVRLPENSTIECAENLTLQCGAALSLQSGKTLNVQSEDMHVAAMKASANIMNIHTLCDTAEHCCRVVTSIGQTAVSMFRSVTQCLGQSTKMVEGNDEVRCANSTLLANEQATVMSKNSLFLTEETSRTDAKLIQLG